MPRRPDDRRRARASTAWALAAIGALAAVLIAVGFVSRDPALTETAATPMPTIVVGVPGGAVIPEPTASPTAVPTASPSLVPTADPTPAATAAPTPAPAVATAVPTAVPPAPTPPTATAQPTPAPTVAVAVVEEPEAAVASFYRHVTAGDFDAAYALWSDRMKATYPREGNLDQRFAETAAIEFDQLFVAERTAGTATVQANFTETYDSGASRRFIGYWRLINLDGRWLLDEPHY